MTDHNDINRASVEALCGGFRQRWLAGEQPRIEDILGDVSGEERTGLLRSLLVVELECRRQAEETPQIGEYVQRFPELREDMADLFDIPVLSEERSRVVELSTGVMSSDDTHPGVDAPLVHDASTLPPGGTRPGTEEATLPPVGPARSGGTGSVGEIQGGPKTFGDYELLEEIARGGMGVVYKARQTSLGRTVALKMILAGQLASEQDVRRFYNEAESAGKLDHPGIVPVHEFGQQDGQHFFSMGYVAGPSLSTCLADGPLAPERAAEIMIEVAQAIAYAHARGVIHRDLKPANVLLEPDGSPRVTDFGLAKRIEADEGLTTTGQILGTPGYMAPEQAGGQADEVTEAADVYALGAMLYALVTGRPPFQADNPLDTMVQVLEADPAPLRLLNPKVEPDLETICLKCLEKDPQHRYPSAAAVAEDLTRYVEGESISVKSLNVVDRMVRVLHRSKYDVDLQAWGTMLFWFAGITLLAEIGIYFHALDGPPYPKLWAIVIRVSQVVSMGVVLWSCRDSWSISTGAAERQMLSIWIGFFVACYAVIGVAFLSASPEYPLDELRVYPYLAIISGLTYFVMGSSYWGQCYLCAFLFFALALVMPSKLAWAPLEFGLLWAVCLTAIGMRLRQLSSSDAGRLAQRLDR